MKVMHVEIFMNIYGQFFSYIATVMPTSRSAILEILLAKEYTVNNRFVAEFLFIFLSLR